MWKIPQRERRFVILLVLLHPIFKKKEMSTKLIILLSIGALVLGVLVWFIIKAWRYRRDHPDEVYWPYNDMKSEE